MSFCPGLSCLSSNMAFLSGVKEPMKDLPKPELLKQYCVLFACPVFHKDPKVTLKTVDLIKRLIKTNLSGAERFLMMEENSNHWWIILKRPFCNTQDNTVERKEIIKKKTKTFMKSKCRNRHLWYRFFFSVLKTK